jgi:hypothetical protein
MKYKAGFVLDTATWRSNTDWGASAPKEPDIDALKLVFAALGSKLTLPNQPFGGNCTQNPQPPIGSARLAKMPERFNEKAIRETA